MTDTIVLGPASDRRDCSADDVITAIADPVRRQTVADDATMLRAAGALMRELGTPDPRIYWADFIASVTIGYAAFYAAATAPAGWAIAAAMVAVLALYRAGSFIHELTHLKHSLLPGFRVAWNVLIGVPLLVPSFLYEGVHTLHHQRTKYGTLDDPEYLPLALMKPWTLPVFVVVSAFAPVALLFRFAVLTPLTALFPPLKVLVRERYSALAINPAFRRRAPDGEVATLWRWTEAAAYVWAIALLTLVATRAVPLRTFAIGLAIASGVLVLNQVRTLVAHLWENESEPMTVTAQYLDSVNVPPPALLPALWAPVGLRYHALHHLVPSMPYHSLGKAHRRLVHELGEASTYRGANYRGLPTLIGHLVNSTMRRGTRVIPRS